MIYINNQAMQESKDRHIHVIKMLSFSSINVFINGSDSHNPSALGLAGTEAVFFIAACMVLSFRFWAKTALITH